MAASVAGRGMPIEASLGRASLSGLIWVTGLHSVSPYPSTRLPPVISMNFFLTATAREAPPEMHALTLRRSNLLPSSLLMTAMYIVGTAQKHVTLSF